MADEIDVFSLEVGHEVMPLRTEEAMPLRKKEMTCSVPTVLCTFPSV